MIPWPNLHTVRRKSGVSWTGHKMRMHLRAAIRKAQGNWCPLCHGHFGRKPISLEHVTPRSLGGKSMGNFIVTHRHCNQARGNTPPTGCLLIWLHAVNARLCA